MRTSSSYRITALVSIAGLALLAGACGHEAERKTPESAAPPVTGPVYVVRDTALSDAFDASGVATPLRQSTVSTKLMGTVTEVLVKEGDHVAAGQTLVRIDARDLVAKAGQVAAQVAEAEAVQQDATVQAKRVRSLFADSVATRAQLDAAETGLARANAAVRSARAASDELAAVASYSTVSAPFAGTVTKRFVDPGAFAAPGAPLVSVQDASQLRIVASVAPDVARGLRRGGSLDATIEGRPVHATIEGVVPAAAGNLSTINAVVANADGTLPVGGTAVLRVGTGVRTAVVVPEAAIVRQADLTGVRLVTATGSELRWIRLGPSAGGVVEVTAGLHAGDRVLLTAPPAAVAARN